MNEDINCAQSMVLSATLEGRTPIGGIRELCSHMPERDMFRWKLEIAVKLREGKPKEALELADVFKDDGNYPEGIESLVLCALSHIEIDNMLLKDGIDPPPPASFTPEENYVRIPSNIIFNYQKTQEHIMLDFQKNEDGSTISLPIETRNQLQLLCPDEYKMFTPGEIQQLSLKFNVTEKRLRLYFSNRRRHFRKLKKDRKTAESNDIQTTWERTEMS